MQEQSVMEFVKWFIGLLLVFGMVAVGIFCFQVQEVNTFKQQVNYQIERRGGLTPEAVIALEEYSDSYFNSRYHINSNQLNQKVAFGEVVEYTITVIYPIAFFPIPDVELSFNGMGVSHIR